MAKKKIVGVHPLMQLAIAIRKEKGISQVRIAEAMGSRGNSICRNERGHSAPLLTTFVDYLDVLGMEVHVRPKRKRRDVS
jgi:transcriptional regulator with XRE-family HTH domain